MNNTYSSTEISKLTSLQFVNYVNKHPKINFEQEVKKHLEETLKNNCIYSNMMEEIPCSPYTDLYLTNINKTSQLALFLKFKNPSYNQISSRYFIKNLNTKILDNFYNSTTPNSYHGNDFITGDLRSEKDYDLIFDAYKILTENATLFSKEDVKSFIDSYIETLYKRITHPKTNFEPFYINSSMIVGAKVLVSPNYYYTAMKGIYLYDTTLLLNMAKYSATNNLDMTKIEKVINDLPYQKWISDSDLEKKLFDESISQIKSIIKNPKQFVEENKLHNKKKISLKNLLKKKDSNLDFDK